MSRFLEELKASLSFKGVERDLSKADPLFNKYAENREVMEELHRAPQSCETMVLCEYRQRGLHREIADYYVGALNWEIVGIFEDPSDRRMQRLLDFTEELVRLRRADDLKRLWRAIISKQAGEYWFYDQWDVSEHQEMAEAQAKGRRRALESMAHYIRWMRKIGEEPEAARFEEERALLERGERRKLAKADPRKMDESLFWGVIARAGKAGDSVGERVEALARELERFGGAAIRQFQKILWRKMDGAYTWDVWALAYAAQQGCSDDSFEAFRAWLILSGRRVYETALRDVTKAMKDVPPGLSTSAESLWSAAPLAYLARTGKAMTEEWRKEAQLKGKRWEESEFAQRYPKLVAHYSPEGDQTARTGGGNTRPGGSGRPSRKSGAKRKRST